MKDLNLSLKVGTPLYMAPELISTDGYKNSNGFAADIYSFAMLTYHIISGFEPFYEEGKELHIMALIAKISNKERPVFTEIFTEPMKDLISKCWEENPDDRPTFKEIFEKLSSNCSSFLFESIDEEEINSYLEYLEEETPSFKKKKMTNNLKEINNNNDDEKVKKADSENAEKVAEDSDEKVVEEDDKIDDDDEDKNVDEDDVQKAISDNSIKIDEALKNKIKESFLSKLNKSIDEHLPPKTINETKNVEFIFGNQS